MSVVTPRQLSKTLKLISDSGIDSAQYQKLLESGRFTELLWEFMVTITPVSFPRDYGRWLVQMRDEMECDGYVNLDLNDDNFPVEVRDDDDREFVLVCFNRDIDDHENPEESELIQWMTRLNLEPEGPPELCMLGKGQPDLQREYPIVARRQLNSGKCPILDGHAHGRSTDLYDVRYGWRRNCRFLASRKRK